MVSEQRNTALSLIEEEIIIFWRYQELHSHHKIVLLKPKEPSRDRFLRLRFGGHFDSGLQNVSLLELWDTGLFME